MTVLLIKAAVAALLLVSLVRAFGGPPPRRLRPVLVLAAGFVGVVGYPIAVLVAAGHHAPEASLLLAGAVGALATGVWAARAPGDGGEGGDDGDSGPDGPIDWEAFDRERSRWEHVRRV